MAYFKVWSILLGVWMVFGGLGVSLCPQQTKQWIDQICPETRPRWAVAAAFTALVWMAWTGYQFLTHASMCWEQLKRRQIG